MNVSHRILPQDPFVTIGGMPIFRKSRQEFAEVMADDCLAQRRAGHILPAKISFSANGQVVALYNQKREIRDLFQKADYIDADGMPLVFASKLLTKTPLSERVATTDFFHDAARIAQRLGLSFYILGSSETNNAKACERIREQYPDLNICGNRSGYFQPADEAGIVAEIRQCKPDVLWVGMGCPRQETFVIRNAAAFHGIGWVKTCGGLLEHILEIHPRAPQWMREAGLEWLHRMSREPNRLVLRYLVSNPIAIWFLATRTKTARRRA